MIKLFFLSSIFSLFSLSANTDTTIVEDWKLIKEEHGIKLYSRYIEGFEYKEVKAILNIQTDLAKAKTYLLNPNNIEKWMSGCRMSIDKGTEGKQKKYYTIFDAPWPISDRDDFGVMELMEYTESKLKIDFESKPNGTPKVTSMVRVPYSKGHLIIEIDKSGRKTLVYQMLVDRGGTLPAYLKDYLENSSPVKTVSKLKEVLQVL